MIKFLPQVLYKMLYILVGIIVLIWSCRPEDPVISENSILSFSLDNVVTNCVVIKKETKTIEIVVPYGTILKDVKPRIETSANVTIVPQSGETQDFSKTVYYTLIGQKGDKEIYTVKVFSQEQPLPVISSFSKDSIEAGTGFSIKGLNFGMFPLAITLSLQDISGKSTAIDTKEFKLIDSSKIELNVPYQTAVGIYQIKLGVRGKSVLSTQRVYIQYPSPQLTTLSRSNLIQTDTLVAQGLFIMPDRYDYALLLKKQTIEQQVLPLKKAENKLTFIINKNIPPGTYQVFLRNITDRKNSRETGFSIGLYDANKPYLASFKNNTGIYAPGQSLTFKTKNFEIVSARYYQVTLSGTNTSFSINGIYDAGKQELNLVLPNTIPIGNHSISLVLNNASNQSVYQLETDLVLRIQ